MAAAQQKVDLYRLDEKFERVVVTYACKSQRFWGRIGHALDPEAFGYASAKLAIQTARTIAADTGTGPSSLIIVIQRLARLMDDGRVTREQIQEVNTLFDDTLDAGLPDEESVIQELVPVLTQRMASEIAKTAMDEYGKRGDFGKVVSLVEKRGSLGTNDVSIGSVLGPGSFDRIAQLTNLNRLPLGVKGLDGFLQGGLPRKMLGMFVGGPGDGKSMALSHVCARNIAFGVNVAYATLEIPIHIVESRIISNLTGVPIDLIADTEHPAHKKAYDIFEAMRADSSVPFGRAFVKEFTPQSTSVAEIRDWVKLCEDQAGGPVPLRAVDYADLMGAPGFEPGKHTYTEMKIVYQGLRNWAVQDDAWVWTASQSRAREERNETGGGKGKGKRRKIDLQHVADSSQKGRIVDLGISLNLDSDGMTFNVMKHRVGRARDIVGPVPADFAMGQIAPVARDIRKIEQWRQEVMANDARVRLGGSWEEPESDGAPF